MVWSKSETITSWTDLLPASLTHEKVAQMITGYLTL